MPRDRLAALRANQSDEDDIGGEDVAVHTMEGSKMDEFFLDVEEIRTNSTRSGKCRGGQEKTLRHSAPQTDENEAELEDFMSDIKKTANRVRAKLKVIENGIEQDEIDIAPVRSSR